MFWEYQPLMMVIRPQNMPQTSNSLLSPTKSMVARGNVYPLCVPPPHTPSTYPSAYPLCVPPPRTPSAYPLHVPHPRTPSAYPLRIPLCIPPPRTPSAYPSAYPLHVPPPRTPSAYPLRIPEWIWLVNVPTTANQITGIEKANYHKILIFFPTTSLKSLHAARIDQLADSNEPATRTECRFSNGNFMHLFDEINSISGFTHREWSRSWSSWFPAAPDSSG